MSDLDKVFLANKNRLWSLTKGIADNRIYLSVYGYSIKTYTFNATTGKEVKR